jgi:AcrR family transcriptional regulator
MTGTRRYSSALRAEQVRLTRRRVLDAARALFVSAGYVGTTLEAVAANAGVSTQTVYNVVGGKAKLLKAVYDVALAGDDEPIAIADRPTYQKLLTEPDGRQFLARYAGLGRTIHSRVIDLIAMVTAQAASGDKDLRSFVDTIEQERATGTLNVANLLADRHGLRAGLTIDQASDILWALTGPELAERLVRRRGWTWDGFEAWLAETMADSLLGPREQRARVASAEGSG